MTAAQKRDYALAMRTLLVAISAQVARSTASAIYALASACKVKAAQAAAAPAAQPPAAQQPAAAALAQ